MSVLFFCEKERVFLSSVYIFFTRDGYDETVKRRNGGHIAR